MRSLAEFAARSSASSPTAATDAAADPYPSRVVKVIVPIAAGGPVDTVTRAVAQTLFGRPQAHVRGREPARRRRQPRHPGDHPGAADVHTLAMALSTPAAINPVIYRKAPFDPDVDLHPLSIIVFEQDADRTSEPAGGVACGLHRPGEAGAPPTRPPATAAPRISRWNTCACWWGSPRHPCRTGGAAPLVSDLVAGW